MVSRISAGKTFSDLTTPLLGGSVKSHNACNHTSPAKLAKLKFQHPLESAYYYGTAYSQLPLILWVRVQANLVSALPASGYGMVWYGSSGQSFSKSVLEAEI